MAGQTTGRTTPTTGKTTARGDAPKPKLDLVDAATGEPVEPTSTAPTPPPPPRPEPSPRTGVLVNVDSVRDAFTFGIASQAVGYVQHVLTARGLDPGAPTGVANRQTREALATFQVSIGESPTGLPTDVTLDYLGFDVT